MAFVDTPPPRMSVAQFLAWEEQQTAKWELADGRPRMMVGGILRHYAVAANLVGALRGALKAGGRRCRAFPEGVKVVTRRGDVFYPDALVLCSRPSETVTNVDDPALVAEVLSPSTEGYDRGYKWAGYQTIPALTTYLLVDASEPAIDLFRRDGERWIFSRHTGREAVIALDELAISLSLADVYDDVTFETTDERPT